MCGRPPRNCGSREMRVPISTERFSLTSIRYGPAFTRSIQSIPSGLRTALNLAYRPLRKPMAAVFPNISKIQFEGPKSKNPLAFRWYNPDEMVEGKSMKDHLRFSVTYWHTFRGAVIDMFGAPTAQRPWEATTDSVENAKNRVRVAFELIEKLGAPFYAFHDRDVAPEGRTLKESN